jgi:hypothetical protein
MVISGFESAANRCAALNSATPAQIQMPLILLENTLPFIGHSSGRATPSLISDRKNPASFGAAIVSGFKFEAASFRFSGAVVTRRLRRSPSRFDLAGSHEARREGSHHGFVASESFSAFLRVSWFPALTLFAVVKLSPFKASSWIATPSFLGLAMTNGVWK